MRQSEEYDERMLLQAGLEGERGEGEGAPSRMPAGSRRWGERMLLQAAVAEQRAGGGCGAEHAWRTAGGRVEVAVAERAAAARYPAHAALHALPKAQHAGQELRGDALLRVESGLRRVHACAPAPVDESWGLSEGAVSGDVPDADEAERMDRRLGSVACVQGVKVAMCDQDGGPLGHVGDEVAFDAEEQSVPLVHALVVRVLQQFGMMRARH